MRPRTWCTPLPRRSGERVARALSASTRVFNGFGARHPLPANGGERVQTNFADSISHDLLLRRARKRRRLEEAICSRPRRRRSNPVAADDGGTPRCVRRNIEERADAERFGSLAAKLDGCQRLRPILLAVIPQHFGGEGAPFSKIRVLD